MHTVMIVQYYYIDKCLAKSTTSIRQNPSGLGTHGPLAGNYDNYGYVRQQEVKEDCLTTLYLVVTII